MDAKTSPRAWSATRLAAVAALVLTVSSPSLAQNAPPPGAGAVPPAREGNIYDHRDHQPTPAEVGAAEAAAGIGPSSPGSETQVEKDVKALLKQTDQLDKRSEDDLKSDSNGRP